MFLKLPIRIIVFLLALCTTLTAQYDPNKKVSNQQRESVEKFLKKYDQDLAFEKNEGQWENSDILYQSRNTQTSIRFLKDRVSIGMMQNMGGAEKGPRERLDMSLSPQERREQRMKEREMGLDGNGLVWNLVFHNANPDPVITPVEKQTYKFNYMLGDESKHRKNVEAYKELRYESMYENIDTRFYGKGNGTMEYDFIVYPGGNPDDIYMELEGIQRLALDEEGNLLMFTSIGKLQKSKPYVYQVINGVEKEIPTHYVIGDNNSLRFEFPEGYDPNHTLIIDPTVLEWSNLLAGDSYEYGFDLEVLPNGDVIMLGTSNSLNYPVTSGVFQPDRNGLNVDVVVSKLSADGSTLLFGTYVGGTGQERLSDAGDRLLVDADGNIFGCGHTRSTDFPTTTGAFQNSFGGNTYDGYAFKLSADGSTLMYGTYIGTAYNDYSTTYGGMALNADGELIIAVSETDGSLPTSPGAYQPTGTGNNGYPNPEMLYIIHLGDAGEMKYATNFGYGQWTHQMRLDNEGNIVVVGEDYSGYIQTTPGAAQPTYSGDGQDLFVLKLTPDMTTAVFCTYLGGATGYETEGHVDFDGNNNIYVVATTTSEDFPTTPGAFMTTKLPSLPNDAEDITLTKFDPNGNMVFSTFYGGIDEEWSYFIEVTDAGEAIIGGDSRSISYSPAENIQVTHPNLNTYDALGAFIAKFSVDGSSLEWGRILGWYLEPWDSEMMIDKTSSDVYVGATTRIGIDIGVTDDAYFKTGASDSYSNYIARLDGGTGEIKYSSYFHNYSSDMEVVNGHWYISGSNASGTAAMATEEAAQNEIPVGNRATTVTKLELCAPITPNNTLSPSSQSICLNGTTALITGEEVKIASKLPNLVLDGVVGPHPNISPAYQWQFSTDAVNWSDVEGATEKDYFPEPPAVTTYFRRIISCVSCGPDHISNIHTLNVQSFNAPVANAGEPQGVCPGGSVTLGGAPTATGGSGSYTYEWTPNVGLDDNTLANPISTPPDDIIYNVMVTDGNGCTKIEQTTVAYVAADAGPDVSFCLGTPAPTIGTIAPPNTSGFTYSWQILGGGGTTGISDPTHPRPQVSPTVPTEYEVIVDGGSGCPDKDTVLVTPNVSPTVDAGPNQAVCIFDSVPIGATTPEPGITYQWAAAVPGMIIDETAPQTNFYAYALPADETLNPVNIYIRAVDDATQCYALDQAEVFIDTIPMLDLWDDHVCPPVVLDGPMVPEGVGFTYRWYTEAPTAPASTMLSDTTIAHPVANVTEPTVFFLEVTSPAGCQVTDQTIVHPGCGGGGGPTCDIPDASGPEVTVCDGDSINIFISKDSDIYGAIYDYVWTPATGILTEDTNVSSIWVSPTEETLYKCEIFLKSSPTTKVCEDTVRVFHGEIPIFTLTNDTIICPGMTVPIGGIPYPGHFYEWEEAEGLAEEDRDEANPYVSPSSTTEYYVEVTVDATGCSDRDTAYVQVQSPVADAGPDGQFCEGAFVVLGAPPVDHHIYDWSPSIGLSDSTSSQPSLTIYTPNTFYLLAIDTLTNCEARDTIEFIEGNPPMADAGDDITICGPEFGIPIGGIDSTMYGFTYSWQPVDGLSNPNIANPIASPSATTTYTLYVQRAGLYGCTGIDEVVVTVDPGAACPMPDGGEDKEICEGQSTTIGTPSGTYAASWTPTTGLDDPTLAVPTASPTETTTYYVTWTDTATGAVGLDSVKVTVHPIPTANAGLDKDVCLGSTFTLGSTSLPGHTYLWTPATDLDDPNIARPTTSTTVNQEYILTVTNDLAGCTAKDTININILTPPTADAGPDVTLCNAPYPTIGTAAIAGLEYKWTPSTGLSSTTVAQPVVSVGVTTTYTLVVTDPATGCSATDEVTVTPDAEIDLGGLEFTVCKDGEVQIGTPAITNYTYSWSPSTGLDDPNIAQPTANPSVTTTYTLTATNNGTGCVRTESITVNVENPSIDAGPDVTVCQGATVQVGSPAITNYTYSWSPKTNLINPTSAEPILVSNGNEMLVLTVTDLATGCKAKDTVFVNVVSTPAPIADAGDDLTFCSGTAGVTIGTPEIMGLTYLWSPSESLDDPNIAQPLASPTSSTLYTVEVYDPSTGCTNMDFVNVELASQTVNAGVDKTVCEGGTVQLSTSYYASSNYIVEWFPSETILPSGTYGVNYRPYAAPTETTTYTLVVTNTQTGCMGMDEVTVTVTSDVAPIADAGDDIVLCKGDTVQIGSAPIAGLNYAWNTSYALSDRYIADPLTWTPSNRNYVVTVTDPVTGCNNVDEINIKINNATGDAGEPKYICQGESVQIGPAYLAPGIDVRWFQDGTLDNRYTQNPIATPSSTTTYGVIFSSTVDGVICTSYDTVTVYVTPAPIAEAGDDQYVFLGESAGLGMPFNNGVHTYEWSPVTSLSADNIPNPVTTPTMDMTYYLTVTDPVSGCSNIDSVRVFIVEPASIGDYVWLDEDKDGIQDPSEVGVSGVPVQLYDDEGNVIGSTTTDAFGYYLFDNLIPGDYTVGFTPPTNYVFTGMDTSSDNEDSDPNVSTGITDIITLGSGENNLDVDAGLIYQSPVTGSIGDYVWLDADNNGIQDVGEIGISGITVTLYDGSGNILAATITSQSGYYLFDNLDAGTYEVGFTLPVGYVFTTQTTGTVDGSDADATTGRTGTVTLSSGETNLDLDAGIVVQTNTTASLGNRVWYDNNNGIQDAGEVGVAGVTVSLYTGGGALTASTTTDAYGIYIFNNLSAGSYYVEFDAASFPTGYSLVTANAGTNDAADSDADGTNGTNTTATITLVDGDRDMTWDAGIYNAASGTGSIGDYVWYDDNGDGIQDASEVGVGGVTVKLSDNGGAIISTTTTDATGYYLFPNLAAGTYGITFCNLPTGYVFTTPDATGDATDSDPNGNGETPAITLTAGENNTSVDAGIYPGESPSGTATIGDYVFNDLDNDGIQDINEPGMGGVKVILYDASDLSTAMANTVTNSLGGYIFTGLDAGDYVVEFDLSCLNDPNYQFSPQDNTTDDGLDSDPDPVTGMTGVISLMEGEDNLTIDAGVYNPTLIGALGDYVWYDLNSNGIQEAGEPGVPGVMVELYNDNDNHLATTTTDNNGKYLFPNLRDDDYYVVFGNLPTGFGFTSQTTGDATGSDADPVRGVTPLIKITGGSTDLDVDAGLVGSVAMLGDYVWLDDNRDGIQDPTESGIPGVTVILNDAGGNPIASTITDADGMYLFPNLPAGDYSVTFGTLPEGVCFTTQNATTDDLDSDADESGLTDQVTLVAGDVNLDLDGGVSTKVLGSLGNYVWYDSLNTDGAQEAGELGVPGVTAILYNSSSEPVGIAVTDGDGYYLFDQLPADDYTVEFSTLPTDYVLTYQDATGSTEPTDSDPDRALFSTTSYTVNGDHTRDVDAGLAKLSVQGYAWHDEDKDGRGDGAVVGRSDGLCL